MAICPMHGYGGWIFPGFIQLLVFIAFFLVVWWLIKQGNPIRDQPDQILKQRLAKGEITKKQYQELKQEISK